MKLFRRRPRGVERYAVLFDVLSGWMNTKGRQAAAWLSARSGHWSDRKRRTVFWLFVLIGGALCGWTIVYNFLKLIE